MINGRHKVGQRSRPPNDHSSSAATVNASLARQPPAPGKRVQNSVTGCQSSTNIFPLPTCLVQLLDTSWPRNRTQHFYAFFAATRHSPFVRRALKQTSPAACQIHNSPLWPRTRVILACWALIASGLDCTARQNCQGLCATTERYMRA